jgi:hypothetical protein
LFLEQLAFARNIAAVALGQHVFPNSGDSLAGRRSCCRWPLAVLPRTSGAESAYACAR